MRDEAKTRKQLMAELNVLRARVARLQKDGAATGTLRETPPGNETRTAAILQNTMHAIQDLVSVHDRNLRVVFSNWRWQDHVSSEERNSFPKCYACYMHREEPCVPCPTLEVFRTGRPAKKEIFSRKTNRTYEVNAYPVTEANGNFDLVTLHARDITYLKIAEQEREQLQAKFYRIEKMESVGRLAGGVAHDCNNMLGVIMGHAEMALQEIDSSHSIHLDLEEILFAANRSAHLVRQLLTFARRQKINPEVLNTNDTIENIFEMLSRLLGEDIELQWNPGADLKPVKMDPSQIEQVLVNLCVNARDAIAGCGKVKIGTENFTAKGDVCAQFSGVFRGEYVLIYLEDNGGGMDEEVLGNLFEPFFTTKEVGKGTGLGLATVYGIVKQNGGYIDVDSKTGEGTKFLIYLPVADLPKSENTLPKKPGPTDKKTATILFVEDESAVLTLGKKILEKFGYRVLMAKSPAEALDLAQNYSDTIDLLITDVIMPGMNGRELAQKLAARFDFRSIYISGHTGDVLEQFDGFAGVNFLQKPFTVNSLVEKVREVLAG